MNKKIIRKDRVGYRDFKPIKLTYISPLIFTNHLNNDINYINPLD